MARYEVRPGRPVALVFARYIAASASRNSSAVVRVSFGAHSATPALPQIEHCAIGKGGGLMSEPEIQAGLRGIEKRLIDRMHLREVLAGERVEGAAATQALAPHLGVQAREHWTDPALLGALAQLTSELPTYTLAWKRGTHPMAASPWPELAHGSR